MKLALLVSFATSSLAFSPSFKALSGGRVSTQLQSTTVNDLGAIPQSAAVATAPKLAQRWRKSTKQLATLGPASSDFETIEKLFLAGADVFRLNFSHGSQEQKGELLDIIRSIEEKYSHPIAVLGDLQGPKLRVSVASLLLDLLHHWFLNGF